MRCAKRAQSRGSTDIRLNQCEFVAAKPGEMIAGAQHLRQPPRERDDQPVASIMAECIVGLFEMIEIEIEQGELMPAAPATGDLRIDKLAEPKPVWQARKNVAAGPARARASLLRSTWRTR